MSAIALGAADAAPARADGRIGLRANLRHIGALTRRNVLQMKEDPESMFDALLMPVIFTLLFVYVFGGAVSGSRDAYVQYMIPGLMAMMGMNIAISVGTGLNSDFKTGVMDRFRTMPIARSSVLIAKVIVELGRMTVSTVILLAMAFVLGLEVKTSPLELVAAMGLSLFFGMSLVWVSMLLGLSLNSPQAVQGIGMLVLMPLQFGSSIFAPTKTMPGWLQSFTEVNPLSNLADACRSLINGGALAHSVWVSLAWGVGITAVTAPLAVMRFRKRT